MKGKRIAVERAPEPDDIIWENSNISVKGALIRKVIYNSLAIVLLGLGFGVQFGLALAKAKISQDETTQLFISTCISVVISLFNWIIQLFLGFTSKKQRNETVTEYNMVLMVKISVFQFLNTGVFVILAQLLANFDDFSLNRGLMLEITQIMAINAVLPNLAVFFLYYF